MTVRHAQVFPEGTVRHRATCTCGHPAAHHDAGTCWTDSEGREVWDATACECPGFTTEMRTR